MAITMRKVTYSLVVLLFALAVAAGGYRFASPKIEVENRSADFMEELIVKLPSSRISFGPLAPGESGRIYFLPQESSGSAEFTVSFTGNATRHSGVFHYSASGQFFRTLRFTISEHGDVSVNVSG